MRFIRYDKSTECPGGASPPFSKVLIEVGPDGFVVREVGFAPDGRVVYRFPDPSRSRGFRGLNDGTNWDTRNEPGDPTPEEFEAAWTAPLDPLDQSASVAAIDDALSVGGAVRRFFRHLAHG